MRFRARLCLLTLRATLHIELFGLRQDTLLLVVVVVDDVDLEAVSIPLAYIYIYGTGKNTHS